MIYDGAIENTLQYTDQWTPAQINKYILVWLTSAKYYEMPTWAIAAQ